MKSKIQQLLSNLSLLELTSKCFLVYVVLFSTDLNSWFLFPLVVIVLGIVILKKEFYKDSKFWGVVCILFLPNLVYGYYIVGNHYFLMTYICILFIIATSFKNNEDHILQRNAKWLLCLVMSFAVIQKLMSPEFMSGEFIGHMAYTGQLFKLPLYVNTEIQEVFTQNIEKLNSLNNIGKEIYFIPPFEHLKEFAVFFTFLTIAVEIIFVILLLSPFTALKNWFFVGFIAILMLTRQETGFIAMLCLLLQMQLGKNQHIFKAMYLILFLVCISLIVVKWGFF